MGKKTVAEYVENPEMIRMLDLMGIDHSQGIEVGKPEIPASEDERLGLERHKPDFKNCFLNYPSSRN